MNPKHMLEIKVELLLVSNSKECWQNSSLEQLHFFRANLLKTFAKAKTQVMFSLTMDINWKARDQPVQWVLKFNF